MPRCLQLGLPLRARRRDGALCGRQLADGVRVHVLRDRFSEPERLLVPRPAGERKAGLRRQRKLSGALLSLSRSVQELTEENQSLKEDLDRVLSSSPTVARTKGTSAASRAPPPTTRPTGQTPPRAGHAERAGT